MPNFKSKYRYSKTGTYLVFGFDFKLLLYFVILLGSFFVVYDYDYRPAIVKPLIIYYINKVDYSISVLVHSRLLYFRLNVSWLFFHILFFFSTYLAIFLVNNVHNNIHKLRYNVFFIK